MSLASKILCKDKLNEIKSPNLPVKQTRALSYFGESRSFEANAQKINRIARSL
jgi:hypothetical protein